ncbi:MAG: hypothetical protein P8Y39_09630, partial [Nitrospirota bacterium]
ELCNSINYFMSKLAREVEKRSSDSWQIVLCWIIGVFSLHLIVTWDVFDFLPYYCAIASLQGFIISRLWNAFLKNQSTYQRSLHISLAFSLIIMTIFLHYDVSTTTLAIPIGTDWTMHGIFLEGLFLALEKTSYATLLFYPIMFLLLSIDSDLQTGHG